MNRRVNLGSGREDLNLRPPTPEAGALTRLRYAPILILGKQLGLTFDSNSLEQTLKYQKYKIFSSNINTEVRIKESEFRLNDRFFFILAPGSWLLNADFTHSIRIRQ